MGKTGKKISNTLVTLSSAAILAVYAAGYEKTNPAAERIVAQAAEHRRISAPAPVVYPDALPGPKPILIPPTPTATAPTPTRKAEIQDQAPLAATTSAAEPATDTKPTPAVVVENLAPASAPEAQPAPDAVANHPAWKDGVYLGWGYSRHGNIEAFVRIENGRIIAAGIEKCQTRYSCSVIDPLPPQVIARQSPDVDYISGATQSADAFYGGIFEALKKAQ